VIEKHGRAVVVVVALEEYERLVGDVGKEGAPTKIEGHSLMLGLAVAAPGDVVGQHREVIRDDQFVLFIRPWPVRRCVRLSA